MGGPVKNYLADVLGFWFSPSHGDIFRVSLGVLLHLETLGVRPGSSFNMRFFALLLKSVFEGSVVEDSECLVNIVDFDLFYML